MSKENLPAFIFKRLVSDQAGDDNKYPGFQKYVNALLTCACDMNEQSSFSNLSVTSPMSQLILQPFRRFTYVTAHSTTVSLLHQRHSSFSNPSFASPTSQALHLRVLASRPCYEYSYILICVRTRKVFTTLHILAVAFKETTNFPSPPLLPSNIFAGRFS